jgi:DnaB-like helicase C terminal domain
VDSSAKSLDAVVIDWIAAVVDNGVGWSSKRDHYRVGMAPAVDPLYAWLDRAWRSSHELPTLATTKQRWSRYPWPTDVMPESFALLNLEQAYHRVDLINHVRELDRLLREGTTNEAYDLTQQFASIQVRGSTPEGIELLDPVLFVDLDADVINLPSWGPAAHDHPLVRGDMALLTARTSVGKSWLLMLAALDALRADWDVVYYSLEMSADSVAKRMAAILGTDVPAWLRAQRAHLHVIDQRMGARRGFTTGDIIRRVEQGARSLVIVDYGELLRPESGGRSTESHNKSAEISQSVQNAAKYLEVPLLVAVQDNRAAVLGGIRPGLENISGSDQWGRDADSVYRLRDQSGHPDGDGKTRTLQMIKSRHTGLGPLSFLQFDPGGAGINVIDPMRYAAINGGAL